MAMPGSGRRLLTGVRRRLALSSWSSSRIPYSHGLSANFDEATGQWHQVPWVPDREEPARLEQLHEGARQAAEARWAGDAARCAAEFLALDAAVLRADQDTVELRLLRAPRSIRRRRRGDLRVEVSARPDRSAQEVDVAPEPGAIADLLLAEVARLLFQRALRER